VREAPIGKTANLTPKVTFLSVSESPGKCGEKIQNGNKRGNSKVNF
jgi:hypothetical protein